MMGSYKTWFFISGIVYVGIQVSGDYLVSVAVGGHRRPASIASSSAQPTKNRGPSVLSPNKKEEALRNGFDILGSDYQQKKQDSHPSQTTPMDSVKSHQGRATHNLPPNEFQQKVEQFRSQSVDQLLESADQEENSLVRLEILNQLNGKIHGQLLNTNQIESLKQVARKARQSDKPNDATAFEISLNLLLEAAPNPDDQAHILNEFNVPVISNSELK